MESPYYFPVRGSTSNRTTLEGGALVGRASTGKPPRVRLGAASRLPPMPNIPGCQALRPNDTGYATKLDVYNKRTDVRPALRALCSTPEAVARVVDWAKRALGLALPDRD